MDAVKYLEEKSRMTYKCKMDCRDCLLRVEGVSCSKLEEDNPKQAITIVEKWSKEHPVATYLSCLLKKYPNTVLRDEAEIPCFCPNNIGLKNISDCCVCYSLTKCTECWNQEMEDAN